MATAIEQSDSNRTAVSSLLIKLAKDIESLGDAPKITPADIEVLHRKLDLILYYTIPKESVNRDPAISVVAFVARHCAECGTGELPLYNIGAGDIDSAAKSEHWRCIKHIPPGITFPVGLWGADWEASGRKPVKMER